jgi:hypothetical protein
MKKLFVFATATLLMTGAAFASKGDKKCSGKECCKSKKEVTAKKEVKEVKEVKKKA